MKEVCIDARMIDCSGIGTYLKNLLPLIKDHSFRITLLAQPGSISELDAKFSLETIPFSAPVYSIREQLLFPCKIPRCDLFWSPHYNVPLLPIRAKKRIVTIHDAYHLAYYETLRPLEKVYAKTVISQAVKLSNRILTDSAFSKKELIHYLSLSDNQLTAIPLGIDRETFCTNQKISLDSLRQAYQLPEKFILFVSNLKPHKNIKGLVKAFSQLIQKKWQDLHLVVVGKMEGFKTGEDIQAILELHPELREKVHFLGIIPLQDLSALYNMAQMLVHPSFYEGFGFPPLEAMSSGCPVIVSHSGSLPEVCGDAAYYVDPNSSIQMTEAMDRLLSDKELQKNLKVKGLEQSRQFCWKRCAELHLKAIEEVLQS